MSDEEKCLIAEVQWSGCGHLAWACCRQCYAERGTELAALKAQRDRLLGELNRLEANVAERERNRLERNRAKRERGGVVVTHTQTKSGQPVIEVGTRDAG